MPRHAKGASESAYRRMRWQPTGQVKFRLRLGVDLTSLALECSIRPSAPARFTQHELMALFFDEIGLPPRMKGMRRLMMANGGLFISEARESVEMMYEFEKPFIVDSSKFDKTFGMEASPHPRGGLPNGHLVPS